MKILSIDHVQIAIPVGREDRARRFYVGMLGFVEIPKPPELAERGGLWLQAGNVHLHLGIESDFHPAGRAHPAFLVDELGALVEKLQISGYTTDTSQPPVEGYKRAHIYDPFGNRIELMEKI
jgi:catechol 2,3-dioxygenase-like lactoylglutathione lyase family enzyme